VLGQLCHLPLQHQELELGLSVPLPLTHPLFAANWTKTISDGNKSSTKLQISTISEQLGSHNDQNNQQHHILATQLSIQGERGMYEWEFCTPWLTYAGSV
jgi:hypothetical protein